MLPRQRGEAAGAVSLARPRQPHGPEKTCLARSRPTIAIAISIASRMWRYGCNHPKVFDAGRSGRPHHHLGRLSPIRLRTESIADDALPARNIGLDQSAPVVARGFLPSHAAVLGITSMCRSRWVGVVPAVWLGTALERGGTITSASGYRVVTSV